MDVFKFNNPNFPTKMEHGELIEGLTSKMWVERYGPAGEFTFVAPLRTNIRTSLPIGTFVSHTETDEIMVVENHELKGKKGEDIEVTVTGRSFETFFENRIVGSNQNFPVTDIQPFHIDNHYSWNHLVELIQKHILPKYLINDNNALDYISVTHTIEGTSPTGLFPLDYERGSLYEHIQKLLEIDNLGIKTVRPGTLDSTNTSIIIHKGVDRSTSLVFSYSSGEIEDINYLFSNKNFKNAALVTGKWVEYIVEGPEAGIDRRMMFVSATDIDEYFDVLPEGADLDLVKLALWVRGVDTLKIQNELTLKNAQIAKDSVKYKYKKDYDLGDLVGVSGGYLTTETEATKMRIIEHVEAEDSGGRSSYPTLAVEPPTT